MLTLGTEQNEGDLFFALGFGLAAQIVGAVLVGVLDAGSDKCPQVFIGKAVVDRTAFPRGLQHRAVAEETKLVADGRDRKTGVLGNFRNIQAVRFGQGVDDADPGLIRD